jgi:hypothetical protein
MDTYVVLFFIHTICSMVGLLINECWYCSEYATHCMGLGLSHIAQDLVVVPVSNYWSGVGRYGYHGLLYAHRLMHRIIFIELLL